MSTRSSHICRALRLRFSLLALVLGLVLIVGPSMIALAEQAPALRTGSYQEITDSLASGYEIEEFRVSGDGTRVVFRVTEQVTDSNECTNFRQQLRIIDSDGANEQVILQGFTWLNSFSVCQTSLGGQYDISHDGSKVAVMHQESPSDTRWVLSIYDVATGELTTVLSSLAHRAFGETYVYDLDPVGGRSYFKLTGDGTQVFFVNSFGPYGSPGDTGEPEASGLTIYRVATNGDGAVALLSNSQLDEIPGVTSSAVNVMASGGYFGTDDTGSWLAAFAGGTFGSGNRARYVFRLDPAQPGAGGVTVLLDLGDHDISGVSVSRDGQFFVYALYGTGDEPTDGVFLQDSAMASAPVRLGRPGSSINKAIPQLSANGLSVSYNIDLGGGSSPSIRWAAADGSLVMPLSQPSTEAVSSLSGISADGSSVIYLGAVMPDVSNATVPAVNLIRASWESAESKSPAVVSLTAEPELTLLRQSIFDNAPQLRTYYYQATGSGLRSMYSFPYNAQAEGETNTRGFHFLGGIKDDGAFDEDAVANDGTYTDSGLTANVDLESGTIALRAAVSTDLGTSAFTDFQIPTRDIIPPTAEFSANPIEGTAPLTVSFTDLSTGDYVRSEWRFQSGAAPVVDPEPPITYTYEEPGVYTVSLSASRDNMSDTEEKVEYITVTEPDGGDANGDGEVNAIDVQLVINAVLDIPFDGNADPDINGDGTVNAVDVQLVINAALGIDISG